MRKIGVDIGGTLIKIAYSEDGTTHYRKFPSGQVKEAAVWVNEHFKRASICLTGGKARLFQSLLGREARIIVEFEATCRGTCSLLANNGMPLDSFLLANVGTGTSIHFVNGDEHVRVGGTGVGGGTIMGLSSLLTGITDYDEIVRLAKLGNRGAVDLKVRHIYEGAESPISGDLTASNFGWVSAQRNDHDVLASVMGLVGETVATVSVFAAEQHGNSSVVFIGSSFIENDLLKQIVSSYTALKEKKPLFVEHGEYSGAIGALLAL